MARPQKNSLLYFPLDVHLDDKFKLIEAEFGLKGFAVIVKLLQKIYGEQGYYCEFTNDVALLFCNEINESVNVVSEILSAAIRRGIFDKDIYEKYSVLTSQGIQKRYFEAVSRRINIEVKREYLLINVVQNFKNVTFTGVSANIYCENVDRNSIKESKEKKIKVNENKENNAAVVAVQHESELERITELYQDNIEPLKPIVKDNIIEWLDKVEADVIVYAIQEAVKHGVSTWKYINAILDIHFNAGRTSLEQIESEQRAYSKNSHNLNVYEDNTGFDYDSIEQIMQAKYDK